VLDNIKNVLYNIIGSKKNKIRKAGEPKNDKRESKDRFENQC